MILSLLGLFACWSHHDAPVDVPTCVTAVAARDLSPGVAIGDGDVVGVRVPCEIIHESACTEPSCFLGRRPNERILGGEMVRSERFDEGLNGRIPVGMRALSMPIRETTATGGGCGDVVALGKVLVPDVRILRVDRPAETAPGVHDLRSWNADILVTAEQAELLAGRTVGLVPRACPDDQG